MFDGKQASDARIANDPRTIREWLLTLHIWLSIFDSDLRLVASSGQIVADQKVGTFETMYRAIAGQMRDLMEVLRGADAT